jgi:hypothetical protein
MLAVLLIWLIVLLILLRILYWVLKSIIVFILSVPRARAARKRAEEAALRERQKPYGDYMTH